MSLESKKDIVAEKVRAEMRKQKICISKSTIIGVMRIAMEVIEGEPVKGSMQKDLAISVIGDIVDNSSLDDDEKQTCRMMIDGGLLSDTIDMIIDATRGKLNINKVKSIGARCCAIASRIIGRR